MCWLTEAFGEALKIRGVWVPGLRPIDLTALRVFRCRSGFNWAGQVWFIVYYSLVTRRVDLPRLESRHWPWSEDKCQA